MFPRTDRGKRSQLLAAESVVPSSRSSSEIITPGSLHEGNTTTDEPTVVGPSRDTVETENYPENAQNLQEALSSYKQLATRYRAERNDQARNALAQEEAAALVKDDAARLMETIEELRNELRDLRIAQRRQLPTERTGSRPLKPASPLRALPHPGDPVVSTPARSSKANRPTSTVHGDTVSMRSSRQTLHCTKLS